MAGTTGTLTAQVVDLLTSQTNGLNVRMAAIEALDPSLKAPGFRHIAAENISVSLSESAGTAQYPAALVYCSKIQNQQKEKFRQFSGQIQMVIEVRQSQDTLTLIEQNTQTYVDAVCALLNDSRGDWGDGVSYTGSYQAEFESVVKGGSNFLQLAKITFPLEVSD